jgi:signal transduction histidine kinase
MIGYSQVLVHSKATEEDKQKAAEYIGQQSMRLKLLSEKLLSLSRLRYDTVDLRPVKVSSILQAALKTLHGQLLSKNIQIVKDIPDILVMGDDVLLETLFQNLIENAIHASPRDAKIELAGAAHDKSFTVTIQDNGIGVSEENLQKITEPFMRVDAARSRQHGGVGVGLALCKRICDIHHTTLVISSVLGQGTKINVDFTIP